MRDHGKSLIAGLLLSLFFPSLANAQGGSPPPGCCMEQSAQKSESITQSGFVSQSQFDISDGAILRLGLSRSHFVDRLAELLFPGKQVTLVISSTRTASRPFSRNGTPSSEEGLVLVEERRFYQIPRDKFRTEDLNSLEQLYLSDGAVYVKINFIRNELANAGR